MKFEDCKVGMKVVTTDKDRHKSDPRFYPEVGTVGKIVFLDYLDKTVKVEWEKGTTAPPGVWWTSVSAIRTAEKDRNRMRIVIYVDKENSRNVIAKDLSSGRMAIARCNPEDEFNFYTGAELAMSRLRMAAHAPQSDDIRPITGCKFKVGDVIIGNKKANKYGFTREKWVGKVARVFENPKKGGGCDCGVKIWFTASPVNDPDAYDLELDQDAFDLA